MENQNQVQDNVQEEFVAAKTGQPLVKGFPDKTVILPLANLQKQFDDLKKLVGGGFKEVQDIQNQQIRYVYQAIAEISRNVQTLALSMEALTSLTGVTQEALDVKTKELEAKRAAEAEAKEDQKNNRLLVDRPSQSGDTVKINFVGKMDGVAFKGGSAKNYHLVLGSNSFIPGFEDQLVGKKAGESVEVQVTFPADYGNADLAGKAAVFSTEVLAVKEAVSVKTE